MLSSTCLAEHVEQRVSDIGEGWGFWAHLGYPHQGEDNKFNPNAKHGVNYLGDMTPFFQYTNQITSNKWNPTSYTSSLDNIEYSADLISSEIDNKTTAAPEIAEDKKFIDPVKKDTVTLKEAERRMYEREGQINHNNWIELQWPYK